MPWNRPEMRSQMKPLPPIHCHLILLVKLSSFSTAGGDALRPISKCHKPHLKRNKRMYLFCAQIGSMENQNFWELPDVLWRKFLDRKSENPENDVMYACAWVPFTGILNIFPAKTFDVPSKPPEIISNQIIFNRYSCSLFSETIIWSFSCTNCRYEANWLFNFI